MIHPVAARDERVLAYERERETEEGEVFDFDGSRSVSKLDIDFDGNRSRSSTCRGVAVSTHATGCGQQPDRPITGDDSSTLSFDYGRGSKVF